MTRSKLRALALGGCGLLLLPALGCTFAADLINPDFLRQVGFDPATIVPPAGKVLVAFTNDTSEYARLYAYVSENVEVTVGFNMAVDLLPGMTVSQAADCPFAFMAPGRLESDFSVNNNAAAVGLEGQQTEVAYQGTVLVFGEDFVCGDLIEIRLIQTGDEQQAQGQYDFRVQVHPGR